MPVDGPHIEKSTLERRIENIKYRPTGDLAK